MKKGKKSSQTYVNLLLRENNTRPIKKNIDTSFSSLEFYILYIDTFLTQ